MSIRLICLCGRGMSLPEKYAGQHVQCPKCRAMLRIPSAREDLALMRWFCKCGLRLKARARTGGRKLRCPRCSAQVAVPFTDGEPFHIEENFLLDEKSGVVQMADEKGRIVEPQALEAGRPPVKEEEAGVYELEPQPQEKRVSAARKPASVTKRRAKKRKKPLSRKATEKESWAVDADK